MTVRNAVCLFAPALLLCVSCPTGAQQKIAACGAPPVVAPDSRPNYFSEQQEEWLGDATAEMVEADFRLVRDPAQNAYLQAIVDRLAATLPGTHIHFRVQLIDSSEINGFSLAGGRIYLTRKLAAQAHSDDELASVLGHEMGHIASHQFAFETTRDLKRLMGVTGVGDRADVFAKVQKLEDARMRSHSSSGGDDDDKQEEADHIGVYVIAAAGYRPQANAEFWDRMFFTKGKAEGRSQTSLGFQSRPSGGWARFRG
jgi:predicted Zn-dependent protease